MSDDEKTLPTAADLGVVFDLAHMTAEDYADFNYAARLDDPVGVSKVLARLVKACPKDWGKPDDYKTYLKLPMFGAFKQISQALRYEVTEEAKK